MTVCGGGADGRDARIERDAWAGDRREFGVGHDDVGDGHVAGVGDAERVGHRLAGGAGGDGGGRLDDRQGGCLGRGDRDFVGSLRRDRRAVGWGAGDGGGVGHGTGVDVGLGDGAGRGAGRRRAGRQGGLRAADAGGVGVGDGDRGDRSRCRCWSPRTRTGSSAPTAGRVGLVDVFRIVSDSVWAAGVVTSFEVTGRNTPPPAGVPSTVALLTTCPASRSAWVTVWRGGARGGDAGGEGERRAEDVRRRWDRRRRSRSS